MPLQIAAGLPTVLIRKDAFEREGMTRSELDTRFNLTDAEFRVEGNLVAIGPLPSDEMIGPVLEYLEGKGLAYYDDVMEMSGNWPSWLRILAM
ncbi:MAG TPA: hypothetical protein VHM24_04345 [Gemmatimonadaceae bacterium]|nr:hypothetical protein [Gemmatimonadaceae bacterium]